MTKGRGRFVSLLLPGIVLVITCSLAITSFALDATNDLAGISPGSSLQELAKSGLEHFSKSEFKGAIADFKKASEMDPRAAWAFAYLGLGLLDDGQLDAAEEASRQVLRIQESGDAAQQAHMILGWVHASKAESWRSRAEWVDAQRLLSSTNAAVEKNLWKSYDRIGDLEEALKHCKSFLSLAVTKQADDETIHAARDYLHAFETHLVPTHITNSPPKRYPPEELDDAIRSLLTPEERRLVTQPLKCTEEMRGWAKQIIASATTERERSKLLFDEVSKPRDSQPPLGGRTATETFSNWKSSSRSYLCSELTSFYVALARSVGIDAFAVNVEVDCNGERVPHGCAAIFLPGEALLVDPTYRWFGIPHRKFEMLSDLDWTGQYLCATNDLEHGLAACKLAPKQIYGHLVLFDYYTFHNRWAEGRAEMVKIMEIESDGPNAWYAQGVMELSRSDYGMAVPYLERGIRAGPRYGKIFKQLGEIYLMQGRIARAKENFELALRNAFTEGDADKATGALFSIEHKDATYFWTIGHGMLVSRDLRPALTNLNEAIRLDAKYADAYLDRAWVRQAIGDAVGSEEDLKIARQLEPLKHEHGLMNRDSTNAK